MRITIHVKIDKESVELVTIDFVPSSPVRIQQDPTLTLIPSFSDFPTLRAFTFQQMNKARRERGKHGLPIGQRNDWDFFCRTGNNNKVETTSANWEFRSVVKPENSRTTTVPRKGAAQGLGGQKKDQKKVRPGSVRRKHPRPLGFFDWLKACRRPRPNNNNDKNDDDESSDDENEEEDVEEEEDDREPQNQGKGKGKAKRNEEKEDEEDEEGVAEAFTSYPRSRTLDPNKLDDPEEEDEEEAEPQKAEKKQNKKKKKKKK